MQLGQRLMHYPWIEQIENCLLDLFMELQGKKVRKFDKSSGEDSNADSMPTSLHSKLGLMTSTTH